MDFPKTYILKNVSRYDINISDLGVRILRGSSKDLLSLKPKLDWELILKSRESGSISLRIKKGLIKEEMSFENKFELNSEDKKCLEIIASIVNEVKPQVNLIDPVLFEEIVEELPMEVNENISQENLEEVVEELPINEEVLLEEKPVEEIITEDFILHSFSIEKTEDVPVVEKKKGKKNKKR